MNQPCGDWRAAGLEEQKAKGVKKNRGERGGDGEVAEFVVDNATAGGLFQWMGRDPYGPAPTVIPRYVRPSPSPVATPAAPAAIESPSPAATPATPAAVDSSP